MVECYSAILVPKRTVFLVHDMYTESGTHQSR